jgi:hypothetical protein
VEDYKMDKEFLPPMEKRKFVKGGERTIASYDWTDIANGSGIVNFFATTLKGAATTSYSLLDNAMDSYTTHTSQGINANNTYNFDVEFRFPKIMTGDSYFFVPIFSDPRGTASLTTTANIGLYHYDGTTETQMGSTISDSVSASSGGQAIKLVAGVVSLSGVRNFKVGDKLRLKVNIVTGASASGASVGGFFHDPKQSFKIIETTEPAPTEVLTATEDARSRALVVKARFKIEL